MSLDPIKGDKLSPRYEGPYIVVRRTTGGSYELKDATGELLGRNFAPSQLKLVLDDFEGTYTYVVDKIFDHREEPGEGMEYYVSWKGYKEKTWEPQENFIERKCISDYWKTRDKPGARSLTQPRQTSKTHRSRSEEQESSSSQRKGKDRTTRMPMNYTFGDGQKEGSRKRGHPTNPVDKSIEGPALKRMRGTNVDSGKSARELRSTRA
ncbi:hypothetical protein BGZ58_004231, partial [Dissophora ornata]